MNMQYKKTLLVLVFGLISFYTQAQENTYTWQLTTVPQNVSQIPIYAKCKNQFVSTVFKNKKGKKNLTDITYQTNNGKIEYDAASNIISLIPNEIGTAIITAQKEGKEIEKMELKVIAVPPPKVYLADSLGKAINPEYPINKPDLMKIRVDAEENFGFLMSNEANYEVRKVELFQFRGGRAIFTKKYQNGEIDLKGIETQPGDGFQIKVVEVLRINHDKLFTPAKILAPYSSFQVK